MHKVGHLPRIWSIVLYGAENWTLGKVDQKEPKSFRNLVLEKISWTDRVRNEEVLHGVKEERNILHTVNRRVNWIGHILHGNCLLKHVTEGHIEVTAEGMRRRG